ncbi:PREDICTED: TOX high mobility group box family member 4-A-like isoform X2 [Poecilia mexicana]|uniref:TOX high mobility group box family member 4-A-like isoform X2 n=1 Tax=Poecilia mexicana TaxID=48701 RepID=UPI00072E6B8A|nr:PREDICTED: TOX high mobility group box family member 4-A-like isoform X2 [Poecilia mexicana]
MDLKFYSELSDDCPANVDTEFMDTQPYGGYSEENKFSEGSDSYLTISGAGHHFLSAETFPAPSLGDEVFEIPPISLDPDQALGISEAVSHFDLTDGSDDTSGSSGSRSLVSNLVVEANDPSFASTFGSQGLERLNLGAMGQAGGGALLSSSALEMGNSSGSHFSRSPPMTIDVQLSELGHGLLEGSQLTGMNPSELTLGLGGSNPGHHPDAPEEPLLISSSPVGSLQDEDMDDFKRSVLVDSPVSISSSPVLSHMSPYPASPSSASPAAAATRVGGKPAALASAAEVAAGGKKGRKKKDPNEPQKPVSAYALFFRDTQSAIKGQNPNASFGEVSKIVASMWDSLADDQKQVYKKKTDAAKKEYLKALAAYKASQLTQPVAVETETSPPVVDLTLAAPPPAAQQTLLLPSSSSSMEANIILDVPPQAGAIPPGAPSAVLPPTQTVTKIIIPKHLLQPGGQVVTLLSGGVGAMQPTLLVSSAARQPPPLQQMQNAPPPPRLQQMAPAPPPLQAKPREGATTTLGQPVTMAATPPPPLQIKIVPASVQDRLAASIVAPTAAAAATTVQPAQDGSSAAATGDDDVTEILDSDEDVMEVSASVGAVSVKSMCVRAGCTNPAIDSEDWDQEYCSNECVATHCRDVFKAWCSIRNQNLGTVK